VRRKRWALAALAVAGLAAATAARAEPAPAVTDAESALDAFHAALAAGDHDGALARLAPEIVIFEAGGAELSRDEYAQHHLAGDMEFVAATTTERVDRRSGTCGDFVWVLTRSKTTGTYRDKNVATSNVETALLARGEGGWQVVHLHWSSRSSSK
jgi:ketosteroid isomerase-like protein